MKLSLAVIERLHARSRRSTDPPAAWHSFSSNFVNQEPQELFGRRWKDTGRGRKLAPGAAATPAAPASEQGPAASAPAENHSPPNAVAPALARVAQCLKSQTPLHVFRSEWLHKEAARGHRWSPCHDQTWRWVKEALTALPPERRQVDADMAEASKGLANSARLARRQGAAAGTAPPAVKQPDAPAAIVAQAPSWCKLAACRGPLASRVGRA